MGPPSRREPPGLGSSRTSVAATAPAGHKVDPRCDIDVEPLSPRSHPARFGDSILAAIAPWIAPGSRVLDPYAGSGRIHELDHADTIGVELEPEWAALHERTIQGDAAALPFPADAFDVVATSPAYGNRFADQSVRPLARTTSYAHALGRRCSPGSGAALQWGATYRALHARHVAEMVRVLRPGGRLVLNVKDHDRARHRQRVVDWWSSTVAASGLHLVARLEVESRGMRYGANRDSRWPEELVVAER